MKRGCFFTLITILTILVMVGLYLYKNNKNWLKDFGKAKITAMVTKELDENIEKLKSNRFKDSLKVLMKNEVKNIHPAQFDSTMNELGYIIKKIKQYSADGAIDSTEFAHLKTLVMENERSKKN
jgi:hypothetical protein